MKFVCAAIAAVAFADKSDFPAFDSTHANCAVSAQFNNITCESLYDLTAYLIQSWYSDTTSPA